MANTIIPKETPISDLVLKAEMRAVLDLPGEFLLLLLREEEGEGEEHTTTMVFCDRNAARALCQEVNRWSRLKEKLGQRLLATVTPTTITSSTGNSSIGSSSSSSHQQQQKHTAAATPWLENFVFYRTRDCPSDVPPPNAKWRDVEYAPTGDGEDRGGLPGGGGGASADARVEWKW